MSKHCQQLHNTGHHCCYPANYCYFIANITWITAFKQLGNEKTVILTGMWSALIWTSNHYILYIQQMIIYEASGLIFAQLHELVCIYYVIVFTIKCKWYIMWLAGSALLHMSIIVLKQQSGQSGSCLAADNCKPTAFSQYLQITHIHKSAVRNVVQTLIDTSTFIWLQRDYSPLE